MSSFQSKKIDFTGATIQADVGPPGDPDPKPIVVDAGDITPGTPKVLLEETTPTDRTRWLASLQLNCQQPGFLIIEHISGITTKTLASGQVNAGDRNFDLSFIPFLPILQGEKVKITFTIFSWATSSNVNGSLQSTLEDVS